MSMDRYPWDLTLAAERGWDRDAHQAALDAGDEDAISLTHPANFLTEHEVEARPVIPADLTVTERVYLSTATSPAQWTERYEEVMAVRRPPVAVPAVGAQEARDRRGIHNEGGIA